MSPYLNLAVYASLFILVALFITLSKIHIRILDGIHTYIHPDNVGGGVQGSVRATIRRPHSEKGSGLDGYTNLRNHDSSVPTIQKQALNGSHKRRGRAKEKTGFDESNAQIFRLSLSESHISTRIYFAEYKEAVLYSCLSFSCLVAYHFLSVSEKSERISFPHLLLEGSMVPTVVGIFCLFRLSLLFVRVSFEQSASRRWEKQISVLCGILGFLISSAVLSIPNCSVFYSRFAQLGVEDSQDGNADESTDSLRFGSWKILVAIYAGCASGLLFVPASRVARSFCVGTDQLNLNLSVISCGKVSRVFLYLNILVSVFTASLWTKPMVVILSSSQQSTSSLARHSETSEFNSLDDQQISSYTDMISLNKKTSVLDAKDPIPTASSKDSDLVERLDESWIHKIKLHPTTFAEFRLWCLLVSSILQLLLLRPNLQMFLNEALLSWYQTLHSREVPDFDYSRAKMFLHNHFLCQVLLQFFIPPTLVLLFLGLSQIKDSCLAALPAIHSLMDNPSSIKQASLFMAWWILSAWSLFTLLNIVLLRYGIIHVS